MVACHRRVAQVYSCAGISFLAVQPNLPPAVGPIWDSILGKPTSSPVAPSLRQFVACCTDRSPGPPRRSLACSALPPGPSPPLAFASHHLPHQLGPQGRGFSQALFIPQPPPQPSSLSLSSAVTLRWGLSLSLCLPRPPLQPSSSSPLPT